MCEQGFIKLSRRFFNNILWKEPRTYSRAEAWLDLIRSARFEASKEIVNNRVVEVRKGEVIASRRFLESRWKWGSSKVINFLEFLKNEGMINQRQTNGQTIITLCKYELYNDSQTSGFQENKPPTNHRQTSDEPPTNQNKECKEREERKEYYNPLSPNGDISPGELPTVEKSENPILSSNQKKEKSCAKKENRKIIPPSLEIVSEYCKERNNNVDPCRFINFYAARGWMMGKNKMQDWQAAVRTWENNSKLTTNSGEPKTSKFSKIRQNVERNLIINGQSDKNYTEPTNSQ